MPIILRLDRMMADRKISLNELSEKVGIANVNLSKIKTGKVSAIRFSTLNSHLQSTGLSTRGYIGISERHRRIKYNFISIHTKQLVLGLTAFFLPKFQIGVMKLSDIFKDMQAKVG